MRARFTFAWLLLLLVLFAGTVTGAEHVLYVTWDGFRWQELFRGADESLLNQEFGGVPADAHLRERFWRESPEARREVLLPFFWGTIAKQGQIFGDPDRHAAARVTNGKNFSYPGYHEMFAGFADDRIQSNDKIPNPNITVLEHLNRRVGFAGRVAAFATWDVFDSILNRERSGIFVQSAWKPLIDDSLTLREQQVNEMVRDLPRLWRGNTYDVISHVGATEYLKKHRPRVLFLGLGETDEWAHARRYDLYLEAAQRSDQQLRELWELVQSIPEYRGRTSLLVSTDHGRGITPKEWVQHNAETVGAEFIWIGALGPDVPARGVRENVEVTQSQIAATIAQLVGEDFAATSPQIAPPLPLAP